MAPVLEEDSIVFADLVTGITQHGNVHVTPQASLTSWNVEPDDSNSKYYYLLIS